VLWFSCSALNYGAVEHKLIKKIDKNKLLFEHKSMCTVYCILHSLVQFIHMHIFLYFVLLVYCVVSLCIICAALSCVYLYTADYILAWSAMSPVFLVFRHSSCVNIDININNTVTLRGRSFSTCTQGVGVFILWR